MGIEQIFISGGIVLAFVIFFAIVRSSFVWIRPFQRGCHERFGKFKEVLGAGFYFAPKIMPVIDRVILIDMRENFLAIPPVKVITRDNVVLEVDAVIFYQVIDPQKALYDVTFVDQAMINLAEPGLRNTIGTLTIDEALSSREVINTKLRDDMDLYTDKWGTKVTKVEVKRIEPPRDIQEAMHRQKTAEQNRRAMVLEAEGQRNSAIAIAEGEKQSSILAAEGHKQASILEAEGKMTAQMRLADGEKYYQNTVAEGQALAIQKVLDAIHAGKADPEVVSYLYVKEALPKIFEAPSNKWILNFDLAQILSKGADLAPAALAGLLGFEMGKEGFKPAAVASVSAAPPAAIKPTKYIPSQPPPQPPQPQQPQAKHPIIEWENEGEGETK
jgi:regulator of protease activity HflC (stomatin/prohibitin superfamily)